MNVSPNIKCIIFAIIVVIVVVLLIRFVPSVQFLLLGGAVVASSVAPTPPTPQPQPTPPDTTTTIAPGEPNPTTPVPDTTTTTTVSNFTPCRTGRCPYEGLTGGHPSD